MAVKELMLIDMQAQASKPGPSYNCSNTENEVEALKEGKPKLEVH